MKTKGLFRSCMLFALCAVVTMIYPPYDAAQAQTVSTVPSTASADERVLDAAVKAAVVQGDFARARSLAVTSHQWDTINNAAAVSPQPMTYGDMRMRMAGSDACRDAQRSYQLQANSVGGSVSATSAARSTMLVTCGY